MCSAHGELKGIHIACFSNRCQLIILADSRVLRMWNSSGFMQGNLTGIVFADLFSA